MVGGPDRHDPATRLVARALGGRLVLQGCADLAFGRRIRAVDVFVDLSHAASMLPVAVRWPAHRRTALVSAATTSVERGDGGAQLATAHHRPATRGRPDASYVQLAGARHRTG